MNIILFDDPPIRAALLPFTFTRPVGETRAGILTIAEKWKYHVGQAVSFLTEGYLSTRYPKKTTNDNYFVNGAVCPTAELLDWVKLLPDCGGLIQGDVLVAARTSSSTLPSKEKLKLQHIQDVVVIDRLWKIFQSNGSQIRSDFKLITNNRTSRDINDSNTRYYNSSQIFIEDGVTIRAAILNAENGPIYLGKDSFVHEGVIIRGPFGMGEGCHVNMGAKIRGDNSFGPFCKMGGEVSNSVVFGYSNKAHDGFLGNSVIGEWCNIGADTNTSNLKNNLENVKIWSHASKALEDSGQTFCGLMMGDHSKCGINTMFNTGTVVGVCANIFGEGYMSKFVPSFAWGGTDESSTYKLERALVAVAKVMERRGKQFNEMDKRILTDVFSMTAEFRVWEK